MAICELRDIYEQIKTFNKNEVRSLFYALVKEGVLDFNWILQTYVAYLVDEKNLAKNMKKEASACILSALNGTDRQRALYFLENAGNIKVAEEDYNPEEGESTAEFHWGTKPEDYHANKD